MSTLSKMLIAVAAGLLIGGGAFGGASPGEDRTATETVTTTETAGHELKGPCDEAEHATDPRCAGAQQREDNDADEPGEDADENEPGDVEDEQGEDQNDEVDNSGPGNAREREPNDDRVDNSGPGSLNSGPGNAEDGGGDDGHSGHSGGDSSGPGSGGSDD